MCAAEQMLDTALTRQSPDSGTRTLDSGRCAAGTRCWNHEDREPYGGEAPAADWMRRSGTNVTARLCRRVLHGFRDRAD